MQLFPCPFCGPRPETEFSFAAEAGKARPEPAEAVSPGAWADYRFAEKNPAGRARELWLHTPCSEFFLMERDTLTHAVLGAQRLRGAP